MPLGQASTADVDTQSVWSHASSSRGSTRITVALPGNTKLAIPIGPSMTISELQDEVLRRANIHKISVPEGDFTIRLESENGPIAFPEDAVVDVLDTHESGKLWLASTANNELIYIRWITPARALDFPVLSAIPTDRDPISRETSIYELKRIAANRVYSTGRFSEAALLPTFGVELFLTACPLHTTDEKETSLADLDCTGNLERPLDVFVIPVSGASADYDKSETLWGFESSHRGTAAFQTCLKVTMAEARNDDSDRHKRNLLKTLFKITHFPPALGSLYALVDENKLKPGPVAVLATCFRELALRIVPNRYFGYRIERALEGSRQIFAWLDSKCHEPSDDIDNPEAALVRFVEFKEITDDHVRDEYKVGKRCDIVEIEASGDPMSTSSSSVSRRKREIKVWTHSTCREDVRLLALAMWGYYDQHEDYYVDFRDNIADPLNDRRIPMVSPNEFSRLLSDANSNSRFRIIDPQDLQGYSSAITLSGKGYVSTFNILEGHVKDVRPVIWNAITGTEMLEPKYYETLPKSLEPLVKQRKLEGSWDLDDWEYAKDSKIDLISPQEAIVICFDLSYSMDNRLDESWAGASNSFRKMDETKQVFANVIARMLGYHLSNNYVGVVAFSDANKVEVTMELSRISIEFKDMMHQRKGEGFTALWDAISKAKDMLVAFKGKYPKTSLRIIALTDGEDNRSQTKPAELCKDLYDAEIVLDSLVVGSTSTTDLFKMSMHTGGYAFCPKSRLVLFQTFLLEPFLDISARPDIVRTPVVDYSTSSPKKPDMENIYEFPPCRPHPLERGSFVALSNAGRYFTTRTALESNTLRWSDTFSIGSGRAGKTFLSEISFILANEQSFLDVYVNERDMSFWKVIMEGPTSSPYENGVYAISVRLTEGFPQTPPLVRFLTPMLHPNITKHGRVCHTVFTSGWKDTYHVHTVLQYMYDLLKNPEPEDAVDELATLKFWTDQNTANVEIRKYVRTLPWEANKYN
ncbi:hypothetical protein GP486_001021, partial [Trichoglossum hirsutum]